MRWLFWLIVLASPCFLLAGPPELWLYYSTNLQRDENLKPLEDIWRRAAAAGYTKVLLADFKFGFLGKLGENEKRYFANVARVRKLADELHLEIVPAVFGIGYSNSLLRHDQNLAEGLPVRDSLFVVNNGEARIVADPPVSLKARPDWFDNSFTIEDGVATTRGHKGGNARLVWKLTVAPYRCYHIAIKARTVNYTGELEIKPLVGRSRLLSYSRTGVKRSQDWTEHHAVFDSLDSTSVTLYIGVWGDAAGELQLRDWKLEETALVNVLRRDGAPCVIKGYVEGKDYEPISDPRMGNVQWPGDYEIWHEPPVIKTKLPNGTQMRVSWYFPPIIHNEQVSCCPSEPKVNALLADEAMRVRDAWGAKSMMMQHDEIRVLNQDKSCLDRGLTPGRILAENVAYCGGLLGDVNTYVWSDMFDPYHNAVDNYYLVNGDLSGSWEGLTRRINVVNWNFEKRDKSLKFFADRGHRQVIAGYYDSDVEGRTRKWLESARNIPGVTGIMYTTWESKYADLERFAEIVRSGSQP